MRNNFGRFWTHEEIQFLIENNHKYTAPQLARLLNRTPSAIETKRRRLGLKANEQVRRRAISVSRLKEKNHNWKGNNASPHSARDRARLKFKIKKPCEVCGSTKAERHHKDGNPYNNSSENIIFLCRKHHMEADGRLKQLIKRNKDGLKREIS